MAKHMAPVPDDWYDDEPDGLDVPVPEAERFAPEVPAREAAAPEASDPSAYEDVTRSSYATPSAGSNSKKKHGKGSNILSNLLIVVGIALLAVAGYIYFNNNRNYAKIDEGNELVAEYARLSDDANEPPEVDWAALKAINPDTMGWLQVPGTVVNYPVFQSGDNDFYLNHAPDRTSSIGGSVFLDYENTAPGMVDAQTIVYGHHMRNGSQFKQIADMDNQEVFDGIKTVWYVTEQGAFDLAPLFVYYTNAEDVNVRQFDFENEDAFHTYLNGYLSRAVTRRADAEQAVQSVKRVFTLSTCNYYDGYGRTLLVCALKSEIPGTPEYEAAHAQPAEQPEPQPEEQPVEQPAEQPEG